MILLILGAKGTPLMLKAFFLFVPKFFKFFQNFPEFSGILEFYCVHVSQLAKSFHLIGHMQIPGFSGFSDFSGFFPEFSGISGKCPSGVDPGVSPDPTVPHTGS